MRPSFRRYWAIMVECRNGDCLTEIHVPWFPSASHFDAYRADSRRTAHAGLFTAAGATAQALTVHDAQTA
jgi:hypothetical protein